jgi:transposase InsO family protein
MFQLAEDWKFRPAGSNPCRAAKCCKQRLLWGRGARASCFDERADHGPLSAGERRAADRNRRDRVELHSEADESSIARRIDGHNDLAGYSGAQAADGVERQHILLRREGIALNHKKLFRLYREERLTVRRRGGRKRALGTRAPMTLPQGPNQRWSLDFVADQLVDGRRFRVLVVVDDFTRECLALVVDTSLSGQRVARELDALIAVRGQPLMVVSDRR